MFIIICLHDQLTRWMIRNRSIRGERYCFSSERFLKRHGRLLGWLVRRVYLGGVLNKTGLSAARTTRISLWVLPFNREDSLSQLRNKNIRLYVTATRVNTETKATVCFYKSGERNGSCIRLEIPVQILYLSSARSTNRVVPTTTKFSLLLNLIRQNGRRRRRQQLRFVIKFRYATSPPPPPRPPRSS